MKELINYATQRHVEIVPEIEVPGHSHAALYAYPVLSCSGNITPIFPFFGGPNMTSNDVFCAGNENTYRFLKMLSRKLLRYSLHHIFTWVVMKCEVHGKTVKRVKLR